MRLRKNSPCKGVCYVLTKKDGSKQVKFTQFDEVLLEAKGLTFSADAAGIGNANGNLLIGKAYAAMLDLESGDAFTIKNVCQEGVHLGSGRL